ncbi:hypothetical protein CR513_50174, partial [Mucuna pruriens]
MTNAICRQGPWSMQVSPCWPDEPICERHVKDDGPFFYLYDIVPLKLGIQLPFTQFSAPLTLSPPNSIQIVGRLFEPSNF